MKPLSDVAVARLRDVVDRPDAGDRYAVHELLGRGGMGAVYRATDRVLQRDVALKVLPTELEHHDVALRLEREARVMAALEHPGIVSIHDAGKLADGRPFYVMRLVRGQRLDEHVRTERLGERLRRFLAICDAVSFAHSKGVIHRDLKPANVMVGEFGEVLVLDWGVAKRPLESGSMGSDSIDRRAEARPPMEPMGSDSIAGRLMESDPIDPRLTSDGVAVGTPGFMAPEQMSGAGTVDARADVYALGAILRTLIESGKGARPLYAIVARATAVNASDRYPSVDALAADVRAWFDGAPVSAYTESMWERAVRFYRRNNALILLLLAYLVVRLFILWWRGV